VTRAGRPRPGGAGGVPTWRGPRRGFPEMTGLASTGIKSQGRRELPTLGVVIPDVVFVIDLV